MTYFKYLVVFCLLCSFVLFYFFAFLKKNMMDITDNICMADFVEAAGVTRQLSFCTNRRITFNDIFRKNSNFTNAYIRFRFRNTLVVRNSLKVLAFSVAFCILFLVAVLGMSRFFSRTVINWNSYESYYYLCEGCISNVGFAKVVMKTFVCLLIPTIFFSELICAFGCIINKVFPFLVTVTTCIAVSFDGDWNIDFWLLIFGTIIVFVLNLLFMKRKDFLN